MQRFVWALALIPLLVLVLRLSVLDPHARTLSCSDAERLFEALDFAESIPNDPVLLIGGRRVQLWESHPRTLQGADVVKRSAPGLTVDNLNQCFLRLIGHYQPTRVVVPLDTRRTTDLESYQLLDSLQGLIDQYRTYSKALDLWVVAPLITPRSSADEKTRLEGINIAGLQWANAQPTARWITVQRAFESAEGTVRPDLFWPDGVTLSEKGYDTLTQALLDRSSERNVDSTGIVPP